MKSGWMDPSIDRTCKQTSERANGLSEYYKICKSERCKAFNHKKIVCEWVWVCVYLVSIIKKANESKWVWVRVEMERQRENEWVRERQRKLSEFNKVDIFYRSLTKHFSFCFFLFSYSSTIHAKSSLACCVVAGCCCCYWYWYWYYCCAAYNIKQRVVELQLAIGLGSVGMKSEQELFQNTTHSLTHSPFSSIYLSL